MALACLKVKYAESEQGQEHTNSSSLALCLQIVQHVGSGGVSSQKAEAGYSRFYGYQQTYLNVFNGLRGLYLAAGRIIQDFIESWAHNVYQ